MSTPAPEPPLVTASYYPAPSHECTAREAVEKMYAMVKAGMRPAYVIPVGAGAYVIWIQDQAPAVEDVDPPAAAPGGLVRSVNDCRGGHDGQVLPPMVCGRCLAEDIRQALDLARAEGCRAALQEAADSLEEEAEVYTGRTAKALLTQAKFFRDLSNEVIRALPLPELEKEVAP